MSRLSVLALLLASLLMPVTGSGQTLEDSDGAPPKPGSAWSREIDFGFTGASGNAVAFSLDLGPELRYRSGRWQWETEADVTVNRIAKEDNENARERFNDVEVNSKVRRELSPRIYALATTTADHRPHAGISSEWLAGGGFGWRIAPHGATTFSVEIAGTFTHERFVSGSHVDYESLSLETGLATAVFQEATLTWSNHLKFGRREGSDLKSDQTIELETPSSPRFSLKIELEWEFNSHPPDGNLKSDYRLVTGFALRI